MKNGISIRRGAVLMRQSLNPRLILKAAKIPKGSGEPNKNKVGSVSLKDLENIANIKMEDLNANTLEQAVEMIRGTCVSMGIKVKG